MVREVDLMSYLPLFMQGYREPAATLRAEEPEFDIVWAAADRMLRNRSISTADEYGIGRLERILGIYPQEGEPLECIASTKFGDPAEPGTYRLFLWAPDGALENVRGSISIGFKAEAEAY